MKELANEIANGRERENGRKREEMRLQARVLDKAGA